MLRLFKKKTEEEQLRSRYQKLMHEAFLLSRKNEQASSAKTAEADAILFKLHQLNDRNSILV